MLARLLRITIFLQIALGAALGYWLQSRHVIGPWSGLALACAMPFLSMLLVDTYSAVVSRGPEPWSAWWKSLLGEYWAGIVVFILRQPWTTRSPGVRASTGGDSLLPVVLVHGYMCNHRIWDDVAASLRQRGHDVFAVDLEPLFCSIDDYVPIVESAVQALLSHSQHKKVVLLGHSMGGLAIRAWLRAHGSTRAARVLTLGTPHVGTKIPQHISTPNGRQMAWGSQWLADLGASETSATRKLFRIALSAQDNIVYPQRAQVVVDTSPTVFEGIGHVQMCVDAAVIAWVHDRLKKLDTISA